jgi:Resolvase, N terminal domain
MAILQALERKGVAVRILNLGMDTQTPTGKLMLTVLGGVAQFEREGIAKANSAGKYKGRKPIALERQQHVLRLAAEGATKTSIASQLAGGTKQFAGGVAVAVSSNGYWECYHSLKISKQEAEQGALDHCRKKGGIDAVVLASADPSRHCAVAVFLFAPHTQQLTILDVSHMTCATPLKLPRTPRVHPEIVIAATLLAGLLSLGIR